jgi:hypothetical protein
MIPKIEVTNKEALLSLFRSGDTYVVECEVSANRTVSYFYAKGSDDAVAKIVVEGERLGEFTSLSQRMQFDESAMPEIQKLEERMQAAANAH